MRFSRWSKDGVWDRLFAITVDDPDFEYLMIDSTIVRAHQHAAGKNGGLKLVRSGGGVTAKIHAVVDALGNPLRFSLTPGQPSAITQAEALTADLPAGHVLGDRATIPKRSAPPCKAGRRCRSSRPGEHRRKRLATMRSIASAISSSGSS